MQCIKRLFKHLTKKRKKVLAPLKGHNPLKDYTRETWDFEGCLQRVVDTWASWQVDHLEI